MTDDNALLVKILKKGLNHNNFLITDIELLEKKLATEKGQNYASILYRFKIRYKYLCENNEKIDKIIHLVSKGELPVGTIFEQINQMNIFENESEILGKIIPKIEQLVDWKIGPEFFCYLDDPKMILMNDLSINNFQNKNVVTAFSKKQVVMVLKTLAKFQARSVFINEQEPEYLKKFNMSIVNEFTHKNFLKIMENSTRTLANVVREWGDEQLFKIADKLEKLAGNINQKLLDNAKYDNDEFCVLNHGDCWTNNIMFRDDEHGEPLEVRLVDFQVSVWSSPAVDLLYFLSACPELDIKGVLDDYFIEKYLETLQSTMRSINCKTIPPTFDELKKSMIKRGASVVMSGLIFNIKLIIEHESKKITTIDEMLENTCLDINIFKCEIAQRVLKKYIPIIDRRGYLGSSYC